MHTKNLMKCYLLALISGAASFIVPSNVKFTVLRSSSLDNHVAHKSLRPKALGIRHIAASSSFDSWLEKNGARSACTVAETDKKLISKQELKAGAEVFSIPIKLCINEKTAKEALGQRADEVKLKTKNASHLITLKESVSCANHLWIEGGTTFG
jgi:hypothetical protein